MKKEDLIWPLVAFTTILAFFVFHVDHREIEQVYSPRERIRDSKFRDGEFDVQYRTKNKQKSPVKKNLLEYHVNWKNFNYRVLLKNKECLLKKIPELKLLQNSLNGRDLLLTSEGHPRLVALEYDIKEKKNIYVLVFESMDRNIQFKKMQNPGRHLIKRSTLDQDAYFEMVDSLDRNKVLHTTRTYGWNTKTGKEIKAVFYDGKLIDLNLNDKELHCSLGPLSLAKTSEGPLQLGCICR